MASKSPAAAGMETWAARSATFQTPHQLSKRRASSTGGRKKKSDNVAEWPHEKPAGAEMARAGFFYRPAQDSLDNVQCFSCGVKLDGWESEDDPVKEHLAHSSGCAWATVSSTWRTDGDEQETRDPMSEELVAARTGTFTLGDGWVHENKRGWKCKIAKMVGAGWVSDASPDTEDGVTCFYCHLSLDGWEPKDDPAQEHRKRSPECRFFRLVEQYYGAGNAKPKGKGRGSTATKASRMSSQSALSTFSQEPSMADLGDIDIDPPAETDDSIMTAGTTTSKATVTGGKKKGKPAKAAKGAKGKKAAVLEEDTIAVSYPDLSQLQANASHDMGDAANEATKRASRTRSVSQQTKPVDSSIVEISNMEVPPKKRGRNTKNPRPSTPPPDPEVNGRFSEASLQLQEELEMSIDLVAKEMTPQAESSRVKRGIKRTSDGLYKEPERDISIVTAEFPAPPKPIAKGKHAHTAYRSVDEQVVVEPEALADFQTHRMVSLETPIDIDEDVLMSEPEEMQKPAKPAKGKKATAKKGKGKKKASSTRSSKATVTAASPEPENYGAEDLARDEMEIEAELVRIAAEQQAVQAEQEREAEYEGSPSHAQKRTDRIHELERELEKSDLAIPQPSTNMANLVATVADVPLPPPSYEDHGKENVTPSPAGSDKENYPSSAMQKQQTPPPAMWLSPTKTTRIPLAPGTPNRSPAKQILTSPSKQISRLTTATPWNNVDLDAVLLISPQPTPNTLAHRLASAAGALQSPEKGLSVEGWVRYRAAKGEEELRRKCEEMVGMFEKEGMRALEALRGVVVATQ